MTRIQNQDKRYDLEQRTETFAKNIREFVKSIENRQINYADIMQLLRSSGSVGANYIEANEALSRKDFVHRIKICRKEAKESQYWLRLLDVAVIPVTIALALGRVANFINGELYGKVTSLPWGVKFQNVEGFRHPSQLYEAAKNLLLLGIAVLSKKYVKKDGQLFGIFLVGYGVFRFGIEFVKEPEVIIASLSMGQWLSIPLIIGGWMLIKKKVKKQEKQKQRDLFLEKKEDCQL